MIYAIGIFGFIGGFIGGLALLKFLLRNRSRRELAEDKNLWWRYGWIGWACAFAGSWGMMQIYQRIFL